MIREPSSSIDPGGRGLPIDACLGRLEAAIVAARDLGVAIEEATAVRDDAVARLGFPADALVVALVGGTGVGKSSIVNALAGAEISPASVRRPTTATPVAWIPAGSEEDLRPLLDWLAVAPGDVHAAPPPGAAADTAGTPPAALAILDLPDLDSIEPAHRERVDAAMPRVDAVIWVTDPEKYHDARLHDELLARWLPRLGRQLVVVNKADRLTADDGELIRRDLERDIERITGRVGRDPRARPTVILASTRGGVGRAVADRGAAARGAVPGDPGSAASDGLAAVRAWLVDSAAAKQVARTRLLATIRDTIAGLARASGLDLTREAVPLISAEARRAATTDASEALLRVVDLVALRRQAVGATRARARARGAGPLGGITSRLFRWSGRQARVADPAAYLVRWRDRGTPGPAAGVVRAALTDALRTATPGTRRRLAAETTSEPLERALGSAVDRAIATDPGVPPTSAWWTVIGLAQTIATGALVLSAVWVFLWVLIRFPADAVVLAVVGRVPIPIVALIVSLFAGYLLARLLGLHAGWLGRRWADRLADRIRTAVRSGVGQTAFEPIDLIESARRDLWTAAHDAGRGCGSAD
ncbi:MAG: GTPase [Candidatus Limnocylindrales bacterium]